MIETLKNRMTLAAKRDAEDKEKKLPAMHKLKMLPEVMDVFNKRHLIEPILENNLLEAVRFWLEPLPDRSLPAYNIQRDLFNVITKLPIKTENLRVSGLGKIVLFYTKDIRPEEHIKRTAERLIREWSRPILGKSDNYRHRKVQQAAFVPSYVVFPSFFLLNPSIPAFLLQEVGADISYILKELHALTFNSFVCLQRKPTQDPFWIQQPGEIRPYGHAKSQT